ncbi:MAG TPA: hypothetical protein VFJ61_11795 [Solirubrobacterales bacterium]|nr:hypothetical protein [Solirubrobacterales bacterium]
MRRRRKRIAAFAALVVCLVSAGLAHAELVERGNLFVKFEGGIAPTALPRHAKAPISVSVDGTIRVLSGERPPALRFITIAINRGGSIDTKGLPRCRRRQIEPATSQEALAACGDALVGEGRYVGALGLPEQDAFPLQGRVLAFNAIVDGQRAILAHVYGSNPVPNSRILVFHIRKSSGTFGTLMTAQLPARLNRHGYLKRISLNLRREFFYRGQRHSYLSAACGAPGDFTLGVFPFVRVGMTFADGRRLASTLIRTCRVKEAAG